MGSKGKKRPAARRGFKLGMKSVEGVPSTEAGDRSAGSVARLAFRRSFGGSSAGSEVGSGLGVASVLVWTSSDGAGGSASSLPHSSSSPGKERRIY